MTGAAGDDKEALIRAYKTMLKEAVEARPSGIRLRIADMIGKNKSFVSQITNPTYKTPVPRRYLEPIFEAVHLTTRERVRFLEIYDRAHPNVGRREALPPAQDTRVLKVELPRLGSRRLEATVDQMIVQFAQSISDFARRR